MKLWWPHCEALVAFAKASQLTGDKRYWERFIMVAEYTFKHFSDAKSGENKSGGGEWFGYLDRSGVRTHDFKGGPYKGCFHVPRALLYVQEALTLLFDTLYEKSGFDEDESIEQPMKGKK